MDTIAQLVRDFNRFKWVFSSTRRRWSLRLAVAKVFCLESVGRMAALEVSLLALRAVCGLAGGLPAGCG